MVDIASIGLFPRAKDSVNTPPRNRYKSCDQRPVFAAGCLMNIQNEMSHDEIVRAKLAALRCEHRDLDEAIAALASQQLTTSLALQRLKKQKLLLKDRISRLEDELTPDIIA
ncbi:hypothetical protein SAMN05444959_102210 [Paracoccus seriniphilus]|uniref:DUF465 domain-containing protein n=2 Tax=Paracoccus seriniphilus TaxID=184748 RepID=A0A239PP84_9RHOB|nr:hypothetical protein SAMN05444959_102210 [Paracoccus seriniphilus]